MNLAGFTQFTIGTPVTTNVLMGLFLLIFMTWLIHMVISVYHWKKYGNSKLAILRTELIYFIGAAILFVILALCISYYSFS